MKPTTVGRKVIRNAGSETHTVNLSVSETVVETMLFSQPAGVVAGTSFTASVPFITTGEISLALSAPYEFSYGKRKSVGKSLNIEFECKGPAGKISTCSVVIIQEQASVPYTMTWTNNNDHACTCEVKGLYKGVAANRMEVIINESNLDV